MSRALRAPPLHDVGSDIWVAAMQLFPHLSCFSSYAIDVWEQYLFHYVSEGGLTFLVMADDSVGRRMPFAFLADLQRRVRQFYPPRLLDDTHRLTLYYHPHSLQLPTRQISSSMYQRMV